MYLHHAEIVELELPAQDCLCGKHSIENETETEKKTYFGTGMSGQRNYILFRILFWVTHFCMLIELMIWPMYLQKMKDFKDFSTVMGSF